jgi:hypothetical protein
MFAHHSVPVALEPDEWSSTSGIAGVLIASARFQQQHTIAAIGAQPVR